MQWDKFKEAQNFLRKANALHPEEEETVERHDYALAIQDVYYDCYMSSFSREALIKRLRAVIAGDIDLSDKEVDPQLYRETYIKEAQKILSGLESGCGLT